MNWQDAILAYFLPKREPMLLVVDPDNLLRDEALLAEIQNRNYDVLELNDEVSFRNLFERSYRSRWDAGEPCHVVVIVHTTQSEGYVPYDLWQKSKRVELSVSALFPNLNALVVRDLDNAYYADLYPAHQQLVARQEMLRSERQTIEFILRSVFDLDPVTANNPARWVEFLIYKHYRARQIPPALETYLRQHLLPGVAIAGLQAEFLDNAQTFYAWLGRQWTEYVQAQTRTGTAAVAHLWINFSDLRLRPLLGYLFSEGLLSRLDLSISHLPDELRWLAIGLKAGKSSWLKQTGEDGGVQTLYNLKARLDHLQALDEADFPVGKTDLRDWLDLAASWAEDIYQANRLPIEWHDQVRSDLATVRQALDVRFWNFIQARYSAVDHYQDNKGPISLATVNRWLYQHTSAKERVALLCLDGMALDQWYLLRDFLQGRLSGLSFIENRTYAIAPTITPVSRQSLFAGLPPAAFEETLSCSDKDPDRWQAFWVNHDIPSRHIAYSSVDDKDPGFNVLRPILESKNLRLGLLADLFDKTMHDTSGMPIEADKRVYYDTLQSRLENGYLDRLFDFLLVQGYRVFLTSDHGNIAGLGNGLTPPKALVESFARRVALFDHSQLAQEYAENHGLRILHTKSLPPNLHPVYLPDVQLFTTIGATQISHGGLSLEEMVVPFVEVRRS